MEGIKLKGKTMELILEELTGQESGIVVYDGSSVIICNWSGHAGLPRLFATGLVYMPEDIESPHERRSEDITECLPDTEDIDLVYDRNGDIDEVFEDRPKGRCYEIPEKNVLIIAPDGWI